MRIISLLSILTFHLVLAACDSSNAKKESENLQVDLIENKIDSLLNDDFALKNDSIIESKYELLQAIEDFYLNEGFLEELNKDSYLQLYRMISNGDVCPNISSLLSKYNKIYEIGSTSSYGYSHLIFLDILIENPELGVTHIGEIAKQYNQLLGNLNPKEQLLVYDKALKSVPDIRFKNKFTYRQSILTSIFYENSGFQF